MIPQGPNKLISLITPIRVSSRWRRPREKRFPVVYGFVAWIQHWMSARSTSNPSPGFSNILIPEVPNAIWAEVESALAGLPNAM